MGRYGIVFAAGVMLALVAASDLRGRAADKEDNGAKVGLVDLKVIFDKLDGFKEESAALKREVQKRELELKPFSDEYREKFEAFSKLPPDKQQEKREEMRQLQKEFKDKLDAEKQIFLKKESEMYDSHYQRVVEETGRQAQRRGLSVVFRIGDTSFEDAPQGEKRTPEQVLKALNRSVVYYRPEVNLTNDVIDALNGR